jgi:hypothetical protein
MLFVLFTLEDFIRVRKLSREGIITTADSTWKIQRGHHKAFRGPKNGRRYEPLEVLQSGHSADGSAGLSILAEVSRHRSTSS